MRFHLLTKHRLTAMPDKFGDLVLEDIIDSAQEVTTAVVDDPIIARQILETNPALNFSYTIEITEGLPVKGDVYDRTRESRPKANGNSCSTPRKGRGT